MLHTGIDLHKRTCVLATVEATSGWYWLADLLATEGVTLSLAHAK